VDGGLGGGGAGRNRRNSFGVMVRMEEIDKMVNISEANSQIKVFVG